MVEKIKVVENDGVINHYLVPKETLKNSEGNDKGETDGYGYRIRKLTPKECWRLMAFSDEAFDKAKSAGVSNSQLYKQAGNSIVVDVLYYIYRNLFIAMPYLFENLKVSSFFSGIGAFEAALDKLYEDVNEENKHVLSSSPMVTSSVGGVIG